MKHSSQRDRELEAREVIRDFGVAPLAGRKPKPHYLLIYVNASALADDDSGGVTAKAPS